MTKSDLEELLANELAHTDLPIPERQWRFHHPRRWRFDFAWPGDHLAVEIEGGTWVYGRHNRPGGFAKDCEKHNFATLDGWRLLRFTGEMIADGTALRFITLALDRVSL